MIEDSARAFSKKHDIRLVDKLGDGKDGLVLSSTRETAIKFLYDPDSYNRELRAYRALQRSGVDSIRGHNVPRLVDNDDALLAIELTIVTPPFLLDFAASYSPAEVKRFAFDADVMAERNMHWAEVFGERWAKVIDIRDEFRRLTGLVLLDLTLNNVRFE